MKLIQDQSPWAEDIEEFGEINFDKLLHLLTGFRSIARDEWDDFEELNGVIDRLGQGNLTTLMQKVKMKIIIVILKYSRSHVTGYFIYTNTINPNKWESS